MRREGGRVVGGRTSGAVGKVELKSNLEVLSDERMVEASKAIDVFHHARWAMKYLKEVTKKLLSPAADLMDRPVVLQDFFDGAAIAEPKEFGAPKEFAVLTNAPAPAASFTDKRMEMTFSFGATARAEANRAQAGPIHSKVESADALRTEKGKGDFGSFGIVRLHEDPAHAGTSPIGL